MSKAICCKTVHCVAGKQKPNMAGPGREPIQVTVTEANSSGASRRAFLASGVKAAGLALLAPAFWPPRQGRCAGDEADTPTDLTHASATTLASLIRRRKISPLELTQLYLAKIKKVDGKLRAVESLGEEQALAQAKKANELLAAGHVDWQRQSLFGVPMTVKDSIEVAGMPTTAGALALRNHISREDATAVGRLRESGAIFLAKTRLPFTGASPESGNLFGRANNPYDLNRTAGGSSGGEAVLIAAGASPLGLGLDGGSSIRYPAHCCGVAGLVPAWGRVSTKGMFPADGCENFNNAAYCTMGPMARRVEDLALMLPVISGLDYDDPFTFPLRTLGDYRQIKASDLTIGYWAEADHTHPTSETITTVNNAAKALKARGANVKLVRPPCDLLEAHDVILSLWAPDFASGLLEQMKKYGVEEDPFMLKMIEMTKGWAAQYSPDQIASLKAKLPELRQRVFRSMKGYDAVLCPAAGSPALPHGTVFEAHVKNLDEIYTAIYSLVFSLPTGMVRCGTSPEKLPIGVQVVGSPAREDVVLSVLDSLEKELGGWQPPPPI
jgi:amidase